MSRRRLAAPLLLALAALWTLAGCTTILTRDPAPEAPLADLAPYGVEAQLTRVWGDGGDLAAGAADDRGEVMGWIRNLFAARADEIRRGRAIRLSYLALSGGGPDGAYGAGLLNGWTARGDRPEFSMVSGVSTGAIIALFAFLGPDYDDELREVYTTYDTSSVFTQAVLRGLTGGAALTDTSGYRALIERYVDDAVVAEIARQYGRGRLLFVGTTNLDASRPVLWNITAIAASGHPQAKRLIHDVIQASSAIPGVFPPVLIPVTAPDGQVYDEMHVDGGATEQVMLLRPDVPARVIDSAVGARIERTIYVVINNKLQKPYDPVSPDLPSIAAKSASSLISGSGAGNIYKLYTLAERDGIALRITAIPRDFAQVPDEIFDPAYMGALFRLGEEVGRAGPEGWSDAPPGFVRR